MAHSSSAQHKPLPAHQSPFLGDERQQQRDLHEARLRCRFEPWRLTPVIYGSETRRAMLDKLVRVMEVEKVLNKDARRHLSRKDLLQRGLAIQLRLVQLRQEHGWTYDEFRECLNLIGDQVPFNLHFGAFIPVLQSQGSDAQIQEWLPKSMRLEVLGCYAQTELGHGSNVQGLETTATFQKCFSDNLRPGFVVHSPTPTATKWWVGGMGTLANYAVLQANLIIENVSHGPHLFIMPLRSLTTHETLPGVEIGDIGPKTYGGFNMNDNGFAIFDHVWIPLENMLCRYASVDENGIYKGAEAGMEKVGYGSMVALRAGMPGNLGLELAQGVTIAIRYTTVRRQFADQREEAQEIQVIKYSSVKERLIPILSKSYAYILAGHQVMKQYNHMLLLLVPPPHTGAGLLPEIHLLTSSLKAVISWSTLTGLEEARKSMGGHGFSIYSGIGEKFAHLCPAQTYEGDNYVLVQQSARALLKALSQIQSGKGYQVTGSASFLKEFEIDYVCRINSIHDWNQFEPLVKLLKHRAGYLTFEVAKQVNQGTSWKELNMDCVRVTQAFVDYWLAETFLAFLDTLQHLSDSARLVLHQVALSFILTTVKDGVADLCEFGMLTAKQIQHLRKAQKQSLETLEPDLVGLTDAFAFSDYELNAILGKDNGDVYKSLLDQVRVGNPINTQDIGSDGVRQGWAEFIQPLKGYALQEYFPKNKMNSRTKHHNKL